MFVLGEEPVAGINTREETDAYRTSTCPRSGHRADEASVAAGIDWWEQLTAAGGEGMVVKPAANLVHGNKGLVQPGVKVPGREYLRIIYGPDYTEERLRQRSLGRKRSLATREYALGMEALDRAAAS